MTSQELSAWLRTLEAGEHSEPLPESAGPEAGRHVLAILQKRRTDLTDDDVRLMVKVVDLVSAAREPEEARERQEAREREEGAPGAVDRRRRHWLMSLGHDPLKPS
ncbi:DUF3140 domain-containing protein [Streptomyces sp. G45]|uniref:DUF3140 domain-containing protein n=1 Tax=Streptomyces sp. G45 TaxID=3406627 RepID=UPI003C24AC0B